MSVSISNAHEVSRSAGHWKRKLRMWNGASAPWRDILLTPRTARPWKSSTTGGRGRKCLLDKRALNQASLSAAQRLMIKLYPRSGQGGSIMDRRRSGQGFAAKRNSDPAYVGSGSGASD